MGERYENAPPTLVAGRPGHVTVKLRLEKVSSNFTGEPRFRVRIFRGSVRACPPAGHREGVSFTTPFHALSKLSRKEMREARARAGVFGGGGGGRRGRGGGKKRKGGAGGAVRVPPSYAGGAGAGAGGGDGGAGLDSRALASLRALISGGFAAMNRRFDAVEDRFASVEHRLRSVEDLVEPLVGGKLTAAVEDDASKFSPAPPSAAGLVRQHSLNPYGDPPTPPLPPRGMGPRQGSFVAAERGLSPEDHVPLSGMGLASPRAYSAFKPIASAGSLADMGNGAGPAGGPGGDGFGRCSRAGSAAMSDAEDGSQDDVDGPAMLAGVFIASKAPRRSARNCGRSD